MSANLLNPNQPNRGVGHTVIDTLPISRSNKESVLYHRRGFLKKIYLFVRHIYKTENTSIYIKLTNTKFTDLTRLQILQ